MDTQAEMGSDCHVSRLVPEYLREALVRAASELDDVMFDRICIINRVVEVQEAIAGAGEQQLGPFTLHPG